MTAQVTGDDTAHQWSRRTVLRGTTAVGLGAASIGGLLSLSACGPRATEAGEDARALEGALLGNVLAKPTEVLVDTAGEPFDLVADTADRLSLWFFGFSNCPDICPVHLGVLAAALDEVSGPAKAAQVCFIGVDTRRDTPSRLREYLDTFDKDFVGLTGPDEILERAQAALGLPSPTFGEPDAEGNYTVGHASQILAFTKDNQCHVVYPFGTRRQTWLRDLPLLATMSWTGVPAT